MNKQEAKLKQKQDKKKKQIVLLTRGERQEMLKALFKKHMGEANAITQRAIFEAIYGSMDNYSDYEIFFLWDSIKKDMNWLRRTTKCFVVMTRTKHGVWCYYVPKTEKDIVFYNELLIRTKRKIDYMMAKSHRAIAEKYYKEEW